MIKFDDGKIVKLKSGGPKMTIVEMTIVESWNEEYPLYKCRWFDKEGLLQDEVFEEHTLKILKIK